MNTNSITRAKEKLGEKEYRLKQIKEQIEALQKERATVRASCSRLREKIKYLKSDNAPGERKELEREQLVVKVIELIRNSPDGVTLQELSSQLLANNIALCTALKEARDRGFEYIKIERKTYYGKRTYLTTKERSQETLRNKILSVVYAGQLRTQEIASRLNLSPKTIQPVIDELEREGQLKSASGNRIQQAKLYSINKNYQEAC